MPSPPPASPGRDSLPDVSEEAKLQFVRGVLNGELACAELKISLFVAALSSYRHDTVLRPFPPMYLHDKQGQEEDRDYRNLERHIEKVPPLRQLAERNCQLLKENAEMLNLLYWLLNTNTSSFSLKKCSKDFFSDIKTKTGQVVNVPEPDRVFEVCHGATSETKFQDRRGARELFYAYHGSRLENFHCILHYGLQGHMSKNGLFGEGIYLSGELSVSLPYSPQGSGWSRGDLGDHLSVLAVCEMIDDPKHVKCQVKEREGMHRSPSRNRVADSMGGEVPEKYYVVRNNDVIRVKYLLVYGNKSSSRHSSRWRPWLLEHKFACLVFLYVLLLVIVALYNSKVFSYISRRYLRR